MYFHPVISALEFFLNYYAPQMKYPWQIVATNCKIGLAVKRLTLKKNNTQKQNKNSISKNTTFGIALGYNISNLN